MSKRILVVEDHVDNRQIIRDMLAVTDYEITEAETDEKALAAIAKQRPDLNESAYGTKQTRGSRSPMSRFRR